MRMGVVPRYFLIGVGILVSLGVVVLLTQSVPRAVYAVRVDNQSDIGYRVVISQEAGTGQTEEIVVNPRSSSNKQVLAGLSRASSSIDITMDVVPDSQHQEYDRATAVIPTHVWQAVGRLHRDRVNSISITIVPGGIVKFMLGSSLKSEREEQAHSVSANAGQQR